MVNNICKEFVASFHDLGLDFDDKFDVFHEGIPKSSQNWSSFLASNEQRNSIHLRICTKRYGSTVSFAVNGDAELWY